MRRWYYLHVVTLTVLSSIGSAHVDKCFDDNAHYPHNDIPQPDGRNFIYGIDLLQCRDECLYHYDCAGIGYKPRDRECYLKYKMILSNKPSPYPEISWKRSCSEDHCFDESDTHYPGNDIPQPYGRNFILGLNQFECRDECLQRRNCAGIGYKPHEGECYLKTRMVRSHKPNPYPEISWKRSCYEDHCFDDSDSYYPHNDIRQPNGQNFIRGLDLFQCRDECLRQYECAGIGYKSREEECYLKYNMIRSKHPNPHPEISWKRSCFEGNFWDFKAFFHVFSP